MDQKSVGNRIRAFRERRAWTQEHLAEAAQVSARTVQRAEEGTLSAESLTAIAGAFNVSVSEITDAVLAQETSSIIPAVYYEKSSTLDWLVNAFGFEILEKHLGPNGQIMHAELKVSTNGKIMCGSPMPGSNIATPKSSNYVTQCLYVFVNDVDAHYKRAKAAKAEILSELEDSYGHRRYQAKDPEGHPWYFASPRGKN